MRKKRNPQCRLDLACVPHNICKELSGMSDGQADAALQK